MMVAKTAGTLPIPKNITTGTKYTNDGIVCMPSSSGFRTASNVLLRAASTPKGIPTTMERNTDTTINAIVSIALFHNPNTPVVSSEITPNAANFQPTVSQARMAVPNIMTGHGVQRNTVSIHSKNRNTASDTRSNAGPHTTVMVSTPSLI